MLVLCGPSWPLGVPWGALCGSVSRCSVMAARGFVAALGGFGDLLGAVLDDEALEHLLDEGFVLRGELADGFEHELEVVAGAAFAWGIVKRKPSVRQAKHRIRVIARKLAGPPKNMAAVKEAHFLPQVAMLSRSMIKVRVLSKEFWETKAQRLKSMIVEERRLLHRMAVLLGSIQMDRCKAFVSQKFRMKNSKMFESIKNDR